MISLEHNMAPPTAAISDIPTPIGERITLTPQMSDAPPSSTSLMPFTLVPPHSPTTGLVSPGNGVN